MKMLICSDGTPPSDNAVQVGGLLAKATIAQTTLLGIAEQSPDEDPLRQALEKQATALRNLGMDPRIVIGAGDPISQILSETAANKYDLVVIGARHKESSGLFWRSERTYELVNAIAPPVMVALGKCQRLARFLVCTGGKRYIEEAIGLTGKIAAPLKADVTLLHVMPEPPALFANLARAEDDSEALLASSSDLGRSLSVQKQSLRKLGVPVHIRVRHGFVVDEIFKEAGEGDYDVIVSGSSHAGGPLRHYIMGDVTRSILNRAQGPVLVARGAGIDSSAGFLARLTRKIFKRSER
ncbi:MAG TPA: universal stress protein [Chthoniobacterales bacterium]|jgi:nucleotide-binding universal stress UspA family protein